LQHEHGTARCKLCRECKRLWLDDVRDEAVAACRAKQLGLQAATKARGVHLAHEILGVDVAARVPKHRRERRRAALVFRLREERHGRQLDRRGAGRQLRSAGAAVQRERCDQRKRARFC
jgi:hypothetical protein